VLNVTAKTYRYLDEEEQAPAEGAKKGGKADKKGAKAKKAKGE
jgi:Tfp pilus assembly protein PilO